MFKQYLLGSTIVRAPDTEGGMPEDERIEITDDDDETTGDPAGEPEDGEDEQPDDDTTAAADAGRAPERERQPSRAERRIQAQQAENRRLAEENARVTRELEDFRRQQRQQPVEDPRVEQERLALMSPEERADYRISQALRRNEMQNQQLASQLFDQSDKVAFDAKASNDKLRQRLAPEVERKISELRAQGRPVPEREVLYTYLVGQRALANRDSARPKAQARAKRQEARPANGRGDAPANRGRQRTAEDRLGDMEI